MQRPRNRAGFTLLEVMIVVVILGILASTVLPQFTHTQESAMESALTTSLGTLRAQIQLYKMQHNGKLPTATLVELTQKTDIDGGTSGTRLFGPYVAGQIPTNPFTTKNDVEAGADGPVPANIATKGWRYNTETGAIKACYPSTDYGHGSNKTPSGKNFDDL